MRRACPSSLDTSLWRDDHAGYSSVALLPVVHMQPPLQRLGQCHANCVGAAGLTADEQLQIGVFADEVELEYAAVHQGKPWQQYVISPHVAEERRDDQTVVFRRFSCAGFVVEAYREAGVDVLRTDDDRLPAVSLDELKTQYPAFAESLASSRLRQKLGIPGDGPWRVVLAGYVLNALARSEDEIRSEPDSASAGDGFFPPRASRP